jgi:ubiquinone/menaquinone biosynthesis C-methylase UbiE
MSRAASPSGLDRIQQINGARNSPALSVGGAQVEDAPAAAAFDAFASNYDVFTEHQDYEWWWSALLPLAEAAGLSGSRVLDVACGTGKSLGPLVARGWSAVGVDASSGMLAEARRKFGSEVTLVEHDMRDLPVLGEFDLVCCLNDAVNDIHDEQQLLETFTGFRRNLVPGGVVVFDVNTIATFRSYAAFVHQEPGRVLVVEGHSGDDLREGALLQVDFVVYERGGEYFWTCNRSSHFQRHHPDAEVRRALRTAGLELAGAYGQTVRTVGALDELRDEKAVYVARAPRVGHVGGDR